MNAAIASIYVGEHVEDVAKHFCIWFTECLQDGMTIERLTEIWNTYWEEGTECGLVPDMTSDGEYWEDHLQEDWIDTPYLYKQAVREKADRFITFDNNAFIDVVAVKGNPTLQQIEDCIFKRVE